MSGQAGESCLGVVSRGPAFRLDLPAPVAVHRAVDGDQEAAPTEHPRGLADRVRNGRVTERSRVERDINRGVAQRQAAHVGAHLHDIRPALDVEKVDRDDVRVTKMAYGPAASGSDVDDDRSAGAGPLARQRGGGLGHRLEALAPQSWKAAFRVLSA